MRQSVIIAGLERSGKTYWAERIAIKYAQSGRTAVLYNAGMDSDFSGALICRPITPEELVQMTPKKQRHKLETVSTVEFFEDEQTGRIIPFAEFRKYYAGKMVKIYAVDNEDALYRSIFKYVYDTLFIFDDFRGSTRYGLSGSFITLSSRKNHSGMRYVPDGFKPGIDTMFIYHALDTPPRELFDYCTRIVLFRLNRVPDARIKNEELWEVIHESVEKLKQLPRYSNIEIILKDYETIKTLQHEYREN